jgi:hypothetical protein
MSDDESVTVKPFAIERAKQGRAKCQKCKSTCEVRQIYDPFYPSYSE